MLPAPTPVRTDPRHVCATAGRYDHPVDGLVTEDDGSVHFLVHFNVPAISPKASSCLALPDYARPLRPLTQHALALRTWYMLGAC